jgi:DEAD/DEAH box helicase domain-containing protein
VVRRAAGFRKLRYGTHEKIGTGDIDLPADEMYTCSLVLHFPPHTAGGAYLERCGAALRLFVVEGMAALLHNVAPLFLLCDPGDLEVAARVRDAELECPSVYLYDACPGGAGLAAGLHGQLAQVLDGCRDLLAACPCAAGCPSCIGPPVALPPLAALDGASRDGDNGKERLLEALAHLHPAAPLEAPA